jgi:iron donor protein CyaY
MSRSDFSDDSTFRHAVGNVFESFIDQVDDLEHDDFDSGRTSGSLSITFDSGAVVMLSRQTPTHEIWLSANFTAWHFLRIDGEWLERDSSESMLDVLSGILSEKIKENVRLSL